MNTVHTVGSGRSQLTELRSNGGENLRLIFNGGVPPGVKQEHLIVNSKQC